MRWACFTSANLAYISRAKVLAESLKKYNQQVEMVLLLNDKIPNNTGIDSFKPFDRVVEVESIGIDNFLPWSFKHNVVELCTATKASAAKFLLNQYEIVTYLDPDIAVFSSLDFIPRLHLSHSVLLTPHQLTPCEDDYYKIVDIELCTSKHGVFNLGFFSVFRNPEGISFLKWWESRLLKFCYEDIPNGIFTDQKWCDLAQAYFPTLGIIRDPGCNVASWNLYERKIDLIGNAIYVNDEFKLKFYHFTKYGGDGNEMTKRYSQSIATIEIWMWYGRMMKHFERIELLDKKYYYGFYTNGDPIAQSERVEYRKFYSSGGYASTNPYIRN